MTITPYLYYEDVGAALKWLAAAFGFEASGPQKKGANGTIRHAAMKVGDGTVMMGHPGPQYRSPERLGQTTQCLVVQVDDVDAHCKRARSAGARIVEEPADTDHGQRRYGAVDPEGHTWYFEAEIEKAAGRRGGGD